MVPALLRIWKRLMTKRFRFIPVSNKAIEALPAALCGCWSGLLRSHWCR